MNGIIIQKIRSLRARLNFFDLLVVFALALILIFFGYNRLYRQPNWIDVRLSVENSDWWYKGAPPKYWYAKSLEAGDSVLDSFGRPVVEIVNIDNYDAGGPYRDIYVDLKVRVEHDQKRNQYLYEFKPLVVGSDIFLNFPNGQLRGTVTAIDELSKDYSFRTVVLEKKQINPSLSDEIRAGVQAFDLDGNLVAEIIEVDEKYSSHYVFSDIRGKSIETIDPRYRDVDVVVKLKSFRELGIDYYINNAALKVNNTIWLQFPSFALEDARIIEIVD